MRGDTLRSRKGSAVLKRHGSSLSCLCLMVVISAGSTATAQITLDRSVAVQLFEPAIGTRDLFFTVEGASVAHHLGFGFGLMVNYQNNPLVLYATTTTDAGGDFDVDKVEREIPLIENQVTADLTGAFGFRIKWLRAQVGFGLPVNLLLRGNQLDDAGEQADTFKGEGIGDLRLQLKVVLMPELAGFSIAFSPVVTFPSACWSTGGLSSCREEGNFAGDPNFTFRPRIAAQYRWNSLLVAANVGGIIREPSQVLSAEVSHRLTYGLAVGYQIHPRLFAMGEIWGQAGFGTKSDCASDPDNPDGPPICTGTSSSDLDAFPLEADVGAHIPLPLGFRLTAGVGFGLIQALGSPTVRAIAGVSWAPDWRDKDGDGVSDHEDECPSLPEDRDGFKDDDGCPDDDNDGDLFVDAQDKCPLQAEDKDGFEDEDGCPEADNDGDGITDLYDHCPMKKETINKFKDEDGCPDVPDLDGDLVADAQDRCPKDAEDHDKFEDEDGCPDPDNDVDGIPDAYDDCPLEAEDIDSFKDDDGCPDPDNDQDGVSDAADRCPGKKETINGYKDEDGCPDKGDPNVAFEGDKMVILKKIYFRTGKAGIRKKSHGILKEVALNLLANPQVKRLRIEGHTDSRGSATRNRELSRKRAEAVRAYLVKRGVAAQRLVAAGLGPDRPIANNRTRRGRAKNRRVDFVIVEQVTN